MPRQGIETAKLGLAIRKYLDTLENGCDFKFFYDHGDRNTSPNDVAAIKGFCGDRVANLNRLADIDLMVADSKGQIKLLIEIEERGVSPKKLLGDVLAVLLCDRCAVKSKGKQVIFDFTRQTRFIVAGVMLDKGNRLKKIRDVIQPRLTEMTGFGSRLNPKNIELIFEPSLPAAIAAVERRTREIICM